MRAKRRMGEADFKTILPLLKMKEDRIEAARRALVGDETLRSIGSDYGYSRQSIGDAIDIVWRVFMDYQEANRIANEEAVRFLPSGWGRATVIAPNKLIRELRGAVSEEIKKLAPSRREAVNEAITGD